MQKMSSYTTILKTVIERYTKKYGVRSTAERIELGRKFLFDFDYPIFDESYRGVFETNFIRNFYMNEIGFETEGLFKLKLENWLYLNMPYFNKLYLSELIKYNPLYNVDLTEDFGATSDRKQNDTRDINQDTTTNATSKEKGTSDFEGEQSSKGFERNIMTDTPQNRLRITSNNDGTGIVEYASQIDENSKNGSVNSSSNSNSTNDSNVDTKGAFDSNDKYNSNINKIDEYLKHTMGKQGNQSYSSMINEYRETFLRIDNQIMKECRELFMLVY